MIAVNKYVNRQLLLQYSLDEQLIHGMRVSNLAYQVAKELAAKVITEKPFECISESAFEEALEFMGKCEKVYCPLKDFGIMNEKNRELLKKAKETGKLNQIR